MPLGKDWLDKVYNSGFAGIKQEVDVRWELIVDELGTYGKLSPIFLLGAGDMGTWKKDDFVSYAVLISKHIVENGYFKDTKVWFEVGNKPDIAAIEWRTDPRKLNETYWECYQAIKSIDKDIDVIVGGISNLTQWSCSWLEEFLRDPIPNNSIIGFHRYPAAFDIGTSYPGFPTREHEMNRLQSLANGHKLFCTGTTIEAVYNIPRGFPFCWINKRVEVTDDERTRAMEHEWNFYSRRGILGMVWEGRLV
jgi:hypothetical protein